MQHPRQGMIQIDGSYGEGGGQILRTALALSAIFKQPFALYNIRCKRRNPGLQVQHVAAVEALARIAEARTEGVKIGSQEIIFIPQGVRSGEYEFELKTAGSVILLLQAIFLPLSFSNGSSHITLIGGTHVAWSPSFPYLSEVFLPTLEKLGVSATAAIERWGFYPKGGGRIRLKINPVRELKPFSFIDRGSLRMIRGISVVSNLPRHVAERQKEQALKRIEGELQIGGEIAILDDVHSYGPGSFLFLLAECQRALAGFSSLGVKGKPAERVADEAVDALKDYLESDGFADPYLTDQIVPFMALAKGNSAITTTRITEHLLTNLWVTQHFLDVTILREGEIGRKGRVEFLNK
jgi:RNA 3'-terminal phosphate cyclase (ATP)